MKIILGSLLLALFVAQSTAAVCDYCHNHGNCTTSVTCDCYEPWTSANCSDAGTSAAPKALAHNTLSLGVMDSCAWGHNKVTLGASDLSLTVRVVPDADVTSTNPLRVYLNKGTAGNADTYGDYCYLGDVTDECFLHAPSCGSLTGDWVISYYSPEGVTHFEVEAVVAYEDFGTITNSSEFMAASVMPFSTLFFGYQFKDVVPTNAYLSIDLGSNFTGGGELYLFDSPAGAHMDCHFSDTVLSVPSSAVDVSRCDLFKEKSGNIVYFAMFLKNDNPLRIEFNVTLRDAEWKSIALGEAMDGHLFDRPLTYVLENVDNTMRLQAKLDNVLHGIVSAELIQVNSTTCGDGSAFAASPAGYATVDTCMMGTGTTWHVVVVPGSHHLHWGVSYTLTIMAQGHIPVVGLTSGAPVSREVVGGTTDFFSIAVSQAQVMQLASLRVDLYLDHGYGRFGDVELFVNAPGVKAGQSRSDPAEEDNVCLVNKVKCNTYGNGHCGVVIPDCYLVAGSWSVAVEGLQSTHLSGIPYTLTAEVAGPSRLALDSPVVDMVRQEEYNHYWVEVPKTPPMGAYKFVLRAVAETGNSMTLWVAQGSLAGDSNDCCYQSSAFGWPHSPKSDTDANYAEVSLLSGCDIDADGTYYASVRAAANDDEPKGYRLTTFLETIVAPSNIVDLKAGEWVTYTPPAQGTVNDNGWYYTFKRSPRQRSEGIEITFVIEHLGDTSDDDIRLTTAYGESASSVVCDAWSSSVLTFEETLVEAIRSCEYSERYFARVKTSSTGSVMPKYRIMVRADPVAIHDLVVGGSPVVKTINAYSSPNYVTDHYRISTANMMPGEQLKFKIYFDNHATVNLDSNPMVYTSYSGIAEPTCYDVDPSGVCTFDHGVCQVVVDACDLMDKNYMWLSLGLMTDTRLTTVQYTIQVVKVTPVALMAGRPHEVVAVEDEWTLFTFLASGGAPLGQRLSVRISDIIGSSVTVAASRSIDTQYPPVGGSCCSHSSLTTHAPADFDIADIIIPPTTLVFATIAATSNRKLLVTADADFEITSVGMRRMDEVSKLTLDVVVDGSSVFSVADFDGDSIPVSIMVDDGDILEIYGYWTDLDGNTLTPYRRSITFGNSLYLFNLEGGLVSVIQGSPADRRILPDVEVYIKPANDYTREEYFTFDPIYPATSSCTSTTPAEDVMYTVAVKLANSAADLVDRGHYYITAEMDRFAPTMVATLDPAVAADPERQIKIYDNELHQYNLNVSAMAVHTVLRFHYSSVEGVNIHFGVHGLPTAECNLESVSVSGNGHVDIYTSLMEGKWMLYVIVEGTAAADDYTYSLDVEEIVPMPLTAGTRVVAANVETNLALYYRYEATGVIRHEVFMERPYNTSDDGGSYVDDFTYEVHAMALSHMPPASGSTGGDYTHALARFDNCDFFMSETYLFKISPNGGGAPGINMAITVRDVTTAYVALPVTGETLRTDVKKFYTFTAPAAASSDSYLRLAMTGSLSSFTDVSVYRESDCTKMFEGQASSSTPEGFAVDIGFCEPYIEGVSYVVEVVNTVINATFDMRVDVIDAIELTSTLTPRIFVANSMGSPNTHIRQKFFYDISAPGEDDFLIFGINANHSDLYMAMAEPSELDELCSLTDTVPTSPLSTVQGVQAISNHLRSSDCFSTELSDLDSDHDGGRLHFIVGAVAGHHGEYITYEAFVEKKTIAVQPLSDGDSYHVVSPTQYMVDGKSGDFVQLFEHTITASLPDIEYTLNRVNVNGSYTIEDYSTCAGIGARQCPDSSQKYIVTTASAFALGDFEIAWKRATTVTVGTTVELFDVQYIKVDRPAGTTITVDVNSTTTSPMHVGDSSCTFTNNGNTYPITVCDTEIDTYYLYFPSAVNFTIQISAGEVTSDLPMDTEVAVSIPVGEWKQFRADAPTLMLGYSLVLTVQGTTCDDVVDIYYGFEPNTTNLLFPTSCASALVDSATLDAGDLAAVDYSDAGAVFTHTYTWQDSCGFNEFHTFFLTLHNSGSTAADLTVRFNYTQSHEIVTITDATHYPAWNGADPPFEKRIAVLDVSAISRFSTVLVEPETTLSYYEHGSCNNVNSGLPNFESTCTNLAAGPYVFEWNSNEDLTVTTTTPMVRTLAMGSEISDIFAFDLDGNLAKHVYMFEVPVVRPGQFVRLYFKDATNNAYEGDNPSDNGVNFMIEDYDHCVDSLVFGASGSSPYNYTFACEKAGIFYVEVEPTANLRTDYTIGLEVVAPTVSATLDHDTIHCAEVYQGWHFYKIDPQKADFRQHLNDFWAFSVAATGFTSMRVVEGPVLAFDCSVGASGASADVAAGWDQPFFIALEAPAGATSVTLRVTVKTNPMIRHYPANSSMFLSPHESDFYVAIDVPAHSYVHMVGHSSGSSNIKTNRFNTLDDATDYLTASTNTFDMRACGETGDTAATMVFYSGSTEACLLMAQVVSPPIQGLVNNTWVSGTIDPDEPLFFSYTIPAEISDSNYFNVEFETLGDNVQFERSSTEMFVGNSMCDSSDISTSGHGPCDSAADETWPRPGTTYYVRLSTAQTTTTLYKMRVVVTVIVAKELSVNDWTNFTNTDEYELFSAQLPSSNRVYKYEATGPTSFSLGNDHKCNVNMRSTIYERTCSTAKTILGVNSEPDYDVRITTAAFTSLSRAGQMEQGTLDDDGVAVFWIPSGASPYTVTVRAGMDQLDRVDAIFIRTPFDCTLTAWDEDVVPLEETISGVTFRIARRNEHGGEMLEHTDCADYDSCSLFDDSGLLSTEKGRYLIVTGLADSSFSVTFNRDFCNAVPALVGEARVCAAFMPGTTTRAFNSAKHAEQVYMDARDQLYLVLGEMEGSCNPRVPRYCNASIAKLACYSVFPACSAGRAVAPCKSVCDSVVEECALDPFADAYWFKQMDSNNYGLSKGVGNVGCSHTNTGCAGEVIAAAVVEPEAKSGLSTGAKAGIGIGVSCAIIIIVAIVLAIVLKKLKPAGTKVADSNADVESGKKDPPVDSTEVEDIDKESEGKDAKDESAVKSADEKSDGGDAPKSDDEKPGSQGKAVVSDDMKVDDHEESD